MLTHLGLRLTAICFAALLALVLAAPSAFAATNSNNNSHVQNAYCTNPPWHSTGSGSGSKAIPGPGSMLEIQDYFEEYGCIGFFDHYEFDGNATGSIQNGNANLSLTTNISFDGLDASFSFPTAASFSPANGSAATHTITKPNAPSVKFNYDHLEASVFSCFSISQTDTLVANIGDGDYQTSSDVTITCG